ncbi:hypothetical protein AeMF1_018572 [Aphanomyces euteiches]|nr:hypothetical protein AeMF1_018572 [Aphanomyces euteiches]
MPSSDDTTTLAFLQHERQRLQRYRRTKKNERAELRATVAQLADELKALTRNKSRDLLLSWKEDALAVQESNENAQSERQALKAQVATLRKVVQAMKMSLDAMIPTWRNVTLLADPVARNLGKKWITERMFHHTDAIFQRHGFKNWYQHIQDGAPFMRDLEISFPESGCVYSYRGSDVLPMSMEQLKEFFYRDCLGAIMAVPTGSALGSLQEREDNTLLYLATSPELEIVHVLCGEFNQNGRCTFVLQQIQCDDNHGPIRRQRNLVFWYDLMELPSGHTAKRVVSMQSQCFSSPDAEFDIELEAQSRGFSLAGCPDNLRHSAFRQILTEGFLRQYDVIEKERIDSAKTS